MTLSLLFGLAWRDLWFDRKVSSCVFFSLMAVIAPLLLLFGLKSGVVEQMQQQLQRDPRTLEVRMVGNGHYDTHWFETLRQRPEVRFAIAQTRALNTQADIVRDTQHFVSNAEIVPTAQGDPLLADMPTPNGAQVILSHSAAQRLGVAVGASVSLQVTRQLEGRFERGRLPMTVSGILNETLFTRPAVFIPLTWLIDLEAFRDGFLVSALGVESGRPLPPTARDHFAKARVYATDINAVGPLVDWFSAQHIETVAQQAQIASVRNINRVLSTIFLSVALISLAGCIASLIGALVSSVERKRKEIAVLRLLGLSDTGIVLYGVIQAMLLAGGSYAGSLLLYWGGSQLLDHVLSQGLSEHTFVCHLGAIPLALALLGAWGVAVPVACLSACRALRIQPSESLREA